MGDFNSQLFKYLSEGDKAKKIVHDPEEKTLDLEPVFTDEQNQNTYLSHDEIWKLIMLRLAASMKVQEDAGETESNRIAYVKLEMAMDTRLLAREINGESAKKHDIEFDDDLYKTKFGPSSELARDDLFKLVTRLGIRIGSDANDTLEIKELIKSIRTRGFACPG